MIPLGIPVRLGLKSASYLLVLAPGHGLLLPPEPGPLPRLLVNSQLLLTLLLPRLE